MRHFLSSKFWSGVEKLGYKNCLPYSKSSNSRALSHGKLRAFIECKPLLPRSIQDVLSRSAGSQHRGSNSGEESYVGKLNYFIGKEAMQNAPLLLLTVFSALFLNPVSVDAQNAGLKAVRMHERIAGVPPSPAVKAQMASLIEQNQLEAAARLAVDSPYFYNITLKNFAKPLTNEDETVVTPLNDMVATIVGMVRDDKPFDQVLYGDVYYSGVDGMAGVSAWARNSNQHYIDIENRRFDLEASLVERSQTVMTGIQDTAGILTTRAYGAAFMDAGTNRAVVRWAFKNFLCNDMEQLSDVTRPDYRIRRDVERNPGGETKVFLSSCKGCHAGMDALAGATAYFDFVGGEVREQATVVNKINAQNKYDPGFVTTNNSWINLWSQGGPNLRLGFAGPQTGNGLRSFGQMLAGTAEFDRCMARRVFKTVCVRDPILDSSKTNNEIAMIQSLATGFNNSNHNMKELFAATAARCMTNW